MNVRLKSYVSVLRIKDSLSILGKIGKDLHFECNDDNLSLLYGLMSSDGVCCDDCSNNNLFQVLQENKLLESVTVRTFNRNESFYDYAQFDFNAVKKKRILVLGAGAAGGTLTYLIAQQGFVNIACVDDDKVEASDVEKTMVYDASDIGMDKVCAIRNRIKRNFKISIMPFKKRLSNVSDSIKIIDNFSPDIIVYAIDPTPSFKLNLDKLCADIRIPIIHAAYSYESILCGPCVVPGQTACMIGYNEYWRKRTGDSFDFYEVSKVTSSRLVHPSISFIINTLSSVILKDMIFCLGKEYDCVSTFNRFLVRVLS